MRPFRASKFEPKLSTPEDIRQEDRAALAALTPQQRAALARLSMASRLTHFRGGCRDSQLDHLQSQEAERRNAAVLETLAEFEMAA